MPSHDLASHDGLTPLKLEVAACCLFCGIEERELHLEAVEDFFFKCVKGRFDFVKCTNCKSLYLEKRLTQEDLPKAYSSYYTHSEVDDGDGGISIKAFVRKCYVSWRFGGSRNPLNIFVALALRSAGVSLDDLLTHYRFAPAAPAKILDYGCGSGAYLTRMQSLGFDVTGVDFDPVVIAALQRKKFTVFSSDEAEDQAWHERFDHITVNHVIEHVTDPLPTLQKIHDWLKPDGKVFIEVPHANAEGIPIFERYWRGFEAPRHLGIPTMKGLCITANAAGFRVHKRIIRKSVRRPLWQMSIDAVPDHSRAEILAKMNSAPPETSENGEFLTLVLEKA